MAIFRISAYRRCMFFVALIIASAVYPSQALAATTVAKSMDETMMNLQKALNNERNAEARYHAYARKAEEEGYATVARLFQAVAATEGIHGNNHQRAIEKLGGTAQVQLETSLVKSTKENLEASISSEFYEQKTMYPEFIKQAHQDQCGAAIVSFKYAQRGEELHVKLFADALKKLQGMNGPQPTIIENCSAWRRTRRGCSSDGH